MTLHSFQQLLTQRWSDTCAALECAPDVIRLTWDIGPYHHFEKPRGYGVTFHHGGPSCHLRFSEKILRASPDRVDGVVRHEIGHVIDLCVVNPAVLNQWAKERGYRLPPPEQAERRADAIAEAIWHTPIRYDEDLWVQSTTNGVAPRPEWLGL